MRYDFDGVVDRRTTDSKKWHKYGDDVLPLWVADMDFLSPEPVRRALRQRVDHGMYGYGVEPPGLRQLIVERLGSLYAWQVSPEEVVFVSGVVPALNLACRALTSPGDGLLLQTPVYQRILALPAHAGRACHEMELTQQAGGRYVIDFDAFEAAITDRTRMFVLCNPHNPVGRVFQRGELERMAEICLRHGVIICSDEIHCDLLFRGYNHLPIASLDPAVAERTITFMAPTKTYNLAGLYCGFAVIPSSDLREEFAAARRDLVREPGITGYAAALAAYRDGQPWLDELLSYLQANRDVLLKYVRDHLPGMHITEPEATYLAWLDCRQAGIPGSAQQFFLREAKVALNDGIQYGRGGEGFVRLNFGCPHSILMEALGRMRAALDALQSGGVGLWHEG
jgi:cystathionine beta-lyase